MATAKAGVVTHPDAIAGLRSASRLHPNPRVGPANPRAPRPVCVCTETREWRRWFGLFPQHTQTGRDRTGERLLTVPHIDIRQGLPVIAPVPQGSCPHDYRASTSR